MRGQTLAVLAGSIVALNGSLASGQDSIPLSRPNPAATAQLAANAVEPVAAEAVEVLVIKVIGIVGRAGYSAPGTTRKLAISLGQILEEGGEVQTSRGGQIQVQIGDQHTFIVDELSKVILREAVVKGGKATSGLGLPYGRVRFDVTSARLANDVKIVAPDATLAIKGTTGAMEVRPGFPTLAYGGEFNRGIFDVSFRNQRTASVTRRDRTDANTPDPADNSSQDQYVEVGDNRTRDRDERRFVRRSPRLFQQVFGDTNPQGIGLPPAITGLFVLDESLGTLSIFDPVGGLTPFLDVTGFNAGAAHVGSALAVNPRNSATTFLRLEQSGNNASLLALDIDGTDTSFNSVANFDLMTAGPGSGSRLAGLAQLGNRLFTNVTPDDASFTTISRLLPGSGQIDPVMNFGTLLDDGLGAVTSRGTLLVAGRLPFTGLSNGSAGVLGADGMLLEVDPRVNYLRQAFSDVTGDFAFDPSGTFVLDPFVDPSFATITDQNVTGLARFNVTPGSFAGVTRDVLVLALTIEAIVDGTPTTLTVTYNTEATNQPGDPRVFVINSTTSQIRDLASEARRDLAPPPNLAPRPSFAFDTSIPTLFADMAYSQQALSSGVVERLARNVVLATAVNPGACANSNAINSLNTNLLTYIDTRAGMGAAITAFRNGLPSNHPCRCPSMGPRRRR